MTEFELEPTTLDAELQQLTFTPFNLAYAVNSQNEFIQLQYTVDDENRFQLTRLNAINLKRTIKSFFVVPEASSILIHCGANVLLLNPNTFECKKLFENVTKLIPHHPGYEPVQVPLTNVAGTQNVVDLSFAPIHVMFYGCVKSAFIGIRPFVTAQGQFGLYDFIIVQDKRFSVITVYSDKVKEVCCQFGKGAVQQVYVDVNPPKMNQYDPYQFKYDFLPPLSNLTYGQLDLEDAAWVADQFYMKIQQSYVALDVRQVSYIQEIIRQSNQGQVYDITDFCRQIIQAQENGMQLIQLLGPNADAQKLVQPLIAEINRRVKRGQSLQKYKFGENGSTCYMFEKQAKQKLAQNSNYQQVIQDKNTFSQLQVQEQICYGLLRDANVSNAGGIIDSQTVRQLTINANASHFKTVDTMCEQLDQPQIKQQAPNCFILMPIIIGFSLGQELYSIDNEKWNREILMFTGKGYLARSFGCEMIEIGEQVIYQLNQQINSVQKTDYIIDIISLPQKTEKASLVLHQAAEKQNLQVTSASFLVRTAQCFMRVSRKKYSQVLLKKLEQNLTLDQLIQVKNEAVQMCQTADKLEYSKIQTVLGLMFYQQMNYMESVNCLLQAKVLSPISVVKLFLSQMNSNQFAAPVCPDRCDQPSSQLLEMCSHLGCFRDIILKQFSNDFWQELSLRVGAPQVTFQQYMGIDQSVQEQVYCMQGMEVAFDDLSFIWAQSLESQEQHSVELLHDIINRLQPQQSDDATNRKRIQALAYYLRVYLDVKSNWIAPLRSVLQKSQLQDKQYLEQFITPNVNLINNKTILRLDEQQLYLRTIFIILLQTKPFQVKPAELSIFFLNKPEEMQKRSPVLLSNPKIEQKEFYNAIGLLAFLKHYTGATKLCDMIRQNDLNQDPFTFTIMLMNAFGVDEILKDTDWELFKELDQLKLHEPNQKIMFWQFFPYVCLKKPQLGTKLMIEKQLIYKNTKTNVSSQQYVFFEKLPLKQSSTNIGYYKPLQTKDESKERDFARTFTPEVVHKFLENLRFAEIEQRQTNEEYLMDNYQHHRALTSLLLYQVSKSVQIAHQEFMQTNYNEQAPTWNDQVAKRWLRIEAAQFLNEYITAYADNDEPQKYFSCRVCVHLEKMVQNYKKVLLQIKKQIQAHDQTLQHFESQSKILNQQELKAQVAQIVSQTKAKLKDNESMISEGIPLSVKQTESDQSAYEDESIQNLLQKQLKQNLNAEELREQLTEYTRLYEQFYQPYFTAAIKAGDVDTAINSLFINCFEEPIFESVFQLIFQLYKKDTIKTNMSKTKQIELQNIFKQLPLLAQSRTYTLNIKQLEASVNKCLTFCEPFMRTLVKQGVYDSLEKAVQTDCLEFLGLNYFGVKERSPVNLLYELLIRFNLSVQGGLIQRGTFNVVFQRLMNVESKTGEYLAKYAASHVIDLLPHDYPILHIAQFIQLGFKLRQLNNSEVVIEKLKVDMQEKEVVKTITVLKKQNFKLDSYAKCSQCGKPLMKIGQDLGQYLILQKDQMTFVHRECCMDIEVGDNDDKE
ncbi:Conserved_hypothetical protein [Hexamita inflata]|uniref:Uncharacterized protein n=1 Tax=Hexamita inflata TaxID=28002 RepID=A0AA86UEX8_9EUKA|nr:Conserved hypothetical protein [Hexamita inflata]